MKALNLFRKCASVATLEKSQYNKLVEQVVSLPMNEKEKLAKYIDQQQNKNKTVGYIDSVLLGLNGGLFLISYDLDMHIIMPIFFGAIGVPFYSIRLYLNAVTDSRLGNLCDKICSEKN